MSPYMEFKMGGVNTLLILYLVTCGIQDAIHAVYLQALIPLHSTLFNDIAVSTKNTKSEDALSYVCTFFTHKYKSEALHTHGVVVTRTKRFWVKS